MINNDKNVSFLLYGDDVLFPDEYKDINYTKIKNLNPKEISLDKDFVFLIINDLSGNNDVSIKTLQKIKDLADLNNNLFFYYVGTEKMEDMEKIFNTPDLIDNDERSIGYVIFDGVRIVIGNPLWDEESEKHVEGNPFLLGDIIIDEIYKVINRES